MRSITLFLALFLSGIVNGQVLNPQPIPCILLNQFILDNFYSNGVIHANDCIESIDAFDFDPATDYSVKAGESIHLNEEISISPDASHQFHAFIEKPGFDLAWYEPYSSGTVGQFEKLEIGLQFEDFINDHIMDYVNTPHLDPSLPVDALNPYNPEDIDVYAEIYWEQSPGVFWGPYRVNAFFYKEFQRNTTDWTELNVPHNFRFRYTPRELGLYKFAVTAVVNGHGTFHSEPFYFQCVPSSDPNASDFVRVGDNKRYFRIGDEPFFPVGQNLTGPNNQDHLAEWDPHPVVASDYLDFHDLMSELKVNGGNYFRYIVSPWQSEIEFEHLNNYTNRLSNAWEFDEIVDNAHELDLRIHYNMAIHYYFETPSGYSMVNWDWERYGDDWSSNPSICYEGANHAGYCYREELDIEDPIDFLSDPEAMKFYKYRLRYMEARWGYSTNIATMELLSEANNFGNQHELIYECLPDCGCRDNSENPIYIPPIKPYNEPGCPTCSPLFLWQNEMCRYIKQDLHQENHPLAVSYTGEPKFIEGDFTYQSPFVDIATYNYYALSIEKGKLNYNNIEGVYHNISDSRYIDKPFMHSEYGTGAGLHDCDNRVSYIKALYFTPFLGLAGSAMNWDFHWNEYNSWQYLGSIRELMEGIKLDEENWRPGEPIVPDYSNPNNLDDEPIEIYYLISEQSGTNAPRKAVGVIANRTYNYFNLGIGSPCTSPENNPGQGLYDNIVDFAYSDVQNMNLKIPNMGTFKDYNINWINGLTGQPIIGTLENTGISGKLELNFPQTLTGNATLPMIFFEVYPQGSTFKNPNDQNTIGLYDRQEESQNVNSTSTSIANTVPNDIRIFPNPSNGQFFIEGFHLGTNYTNWVVQNAQGQEISNGKCNSDRIVIDLNRFGEGIYFISLHGADRNQFFKVIKE